MRFSFWRSGRSAKAGDSKLVPAPHVLSAVQGNAIVLLDTRQECYYTLNAVGALVWTMLGVGATSAEMGERIRREYVLPEDADPGLVERDVHRLLGELRRFGLAIPEGSCAASLS